jgi:hypothetical protein
MYSVANMAQKVSNEFMMRLYILCAGTSALGNTMMCWNLVNKSFPKYHSYYYTDINIALKVSITGLGLVSGLAFPITTPALYYYNKSFIDEEKER